MTTPRTLVIQQSRMHTICNSCVPTHPQPKLHPDKTAERSQLQTPTTQHTNRNTHTPPKKQHFLDTAVSTHPKRTGTTNDGEMQAEKFAAQRAKQPSRVTGSRSTQQHRETTMPTVNPMYGGTATRTQGKTKSNIRSCVSHATGTHTHAQDVNSTCSVPRHKS